MTSWKQLQITSATKADCALALSFDGYAKSEARHHDRIVAATEKVGFAGKLGQWLDVVGDDPTHERLLVLGAGALPSDDPHLWTMLGGHLFDAMAALRLSSISLPSHKELGGPAALENLVLGALLHSFRLQQVRVLDHPRFDPAALVLDRDEVNIGEHAQQIANAVNRARAWVEEPANRLTTTAWAEESRALEQYGVTVRVFDIDDLREMKASALLAVGMGAEHGPLLVVAEWRGDPTRSEWDAVLVGKGLTFDGGGLNLKVRPVIEKMKFDMAGGAAVLGAVQLAASRKAPCNVVAVVAMAENAIDALSYRSGDVIGSLSGLSIEVVNTDAEGRIVVADALTYGLRTYAPHFIVDVATLTGAMTSVLHEVFAGCYATDDKLADSLFSAGEAVGERLWRLPLSDSQDYLVDSDVADVANFGALGFLGLGGGSPTAGAKFLQRFVPGTRWAHIDIAGTAWATRRTARSGKGATGFGVRLLDRWLSSLESSH